MGLTPFKIEANVPGRTSRLWLDGEDVTDRYQLRRVAFDCGVSQDVPVLYVELIGSGVVEGEAVVRQIAPGSINLEELDAGALTNEITKQLQISDGSTSVGELCVRALRSLHDGN